MSYVGSFGHWLSLTDVLILVVTFGGILAIEYFWPKDKDDDYE